MKSPPTLPSDAAMANLALLLRPPEPASEGESDETKPPVELVEEEPVARPDDTLRLGTGSGVGDADEDDGLMAKSRVETLRYPLDSVVSTENCTSTRSAPLLGGVPESSIVAGSK